MPDNQNKIVLITGGSRGLGKSMARHAARHGFDVIQTYVSKQAEAEAVAADITAIGRKAVALELDICDSASFAAFAETVRSVLATRFDSNAFDALINNAGAGMHKPFTETSENDLDWLYAMHLKGPYLLTQHLLPLMRDGGRIMNITSGLARFTIPGASAYGALKAALEQLTRYMAQELAPRQITAIALAPGATATDFNGGKTRDDAQTNAAIAARVALGRVGQPDDIGAAAAALLDTDTRWINGERIEVSGGQSL